MWTLICLVSKMKGRVSYSGVMVFQRTIARKKTSSATKQGVIKYDMWNALQNRLLPC